MTPEPALASGRGLARGLASALDIPANLAEAGGAPAAAAMMALKRAHDAGGGVMRQQHIAQAQQQIAALDPARHGTLVQHLQARVLALGGRGGDTRIAHVTPGEIVIPARLQTSLVLAALRTAARTAGIDPTTLIVGSARNAINPKTGQPEFDDDGQGDAGQTDTANDGDKNDEQTADASSDPWSPDDRHWAQTIAYSEGSKDRDPAVAQAIVSTVMNRLGNPGFQNNQTLAGLIKAPRQFKAIGDQTNQAWRTLQNPDDMSETEKTVFNQYNDAVDKRLNGELPDNTGGATFFYSGEPSETTREAMSLYPLIQTKKIGSFNFYKPDTSVEPRKPKSKK